MRPSLIYEVWSMQFQSLNFTQRTLREGAYKNFHGIYGRYTEGVSFNLRPIYYVFISFQELQTFPIDLHTLNVKSCTPAVQLMLRIFIQYSPNYQETGVI